GLVALGNLVQVEGTVSEFRPERERYFPSITEITRPFVKVVSKDNPLPVPLVLTATDLDAKGRLDQLERFEGMRVRADVVVVGPTGGFTDEKTGKTTSNGVFFATLVGTPRPFREPGIDLVDVLINKLPNTTPTFDMNPELLRVDSRAPTGSQALDV